MDNRLEKLLFRLRDLTSERRQTWTLAADRSELDFQTTVGDWTLEIRSIDGDGQPPYQFGLVTDGGEFIESVQNRPVRAGMNVPDRESAKRRNVALRELFESARRQVTGVDKALDEISQLLGDV